MAAGLEPPLSMMPLLAGKIAIVTGAASGIGRAGARAFAAAGATVVVADINEQGGERVAQEIGRGRAQFQPVDVRDTLQVQRMATNTIAKFGRIDVLFHNAMNVPLVNRGDGRATELAEERGTRSSTSFSTVPFIAVST